MASPGPLLCALGLLLCGAVNLGLFAPLVSNSEKPIIGKEAGRDPGPERVSALAAGAAGLQRVPPAWEIPNCKVRTCAVLCRRAEPRRCLDRAEI